MPTVWVRVPSTPLIIKVKVVKMNYPKNAVEWLEILQDNLDNLRSMIVKYHPMSNSKQPAWNLLNPPETACAAVREKIVRDNKQFPLLRFDTAVGENDSKAVVNILNETWFGLPEHISSRSIPGFGTLCVLCEECELVYVEPDDGK